MLRWVVLAVVVVVLTAAATLVGKFAPNPARNPGICRSLR